MLTILNRWDFLWKLVSSPGWIIIEQGQTFLYICETHGEHSPTIELTRWTREARGYKIKGIMELPEPH